MVTMIVVVNVIIIIVVVVVNLAVTFRSLFFVESAYTDWFKFYILYQFLMSKRLHIEC